MPPEPRVTGRFARAAPAVRLLCFPYAGGGGRTFRTWAAHLPAAIEVEPVELPGHARRIREPPIDRLPRLARQLAGELAPKLDRPFALFGHSIGAWIAFEVARELRRRTGLQPLLLVVCGFPSPRLPRPSSMVHRLPDPLFRNHLLRIGALPAAAAADPELVDLLLPALRADFSLSATYAFRDEPPLDCPILACAGWGDPGAGRRELDAWGRETSGACVVERFPGGHMFVERRPEPLLASVGRLIGTAAGAVGRPPGR